MYIAHRAPIIQHTSRASSSPPPRISAFLRITRYSRDSFVVARALNLEIVSMPCSRRRFIINVERYRDVRRNEEDEVDDGIR